MQRRYHIAFEQLLTHGATYASLRTHRYLQGGRPTWGSSASMALRFFWEMTQPGQIRVTAFLRH